MRAAQVTRLDGPDAVEVVDLPEPAGDGVVIEVAAAGVCFPDVLLTRGQYQITPDLPFVPGSEVAGAVRSAPVSSGFAAGDRVAAFPFLGGFAEVVEADAAMVFPLPDEVSFEQGAALPMNYLTCHFALRRARRPARGRDGAGAGRGGRHRHGGGAAGRRVGCPGHRRRLLRRQGRRSLAPRARTRSCSPRASGMPSPTSPAGAVSTSSSTRSAATASPTRCARSHPVAGCSSSGSPPAPSRRSRSTGCCSATSRSSASGGARGGPAAAAPARGSCAGSGTTWFPCCESGALDPVIGEVRDLDDVVAALTAIDERRATGKILLTPWPAESLTP